jgi:toxin ParE1/3/4
MTETTLRVAEEAEGDLHRMRQEGIERFGEVQAAAYMTALWEVLELIALSPKLAPVRRKLTRPVRVHPWRAHLIVYSEDGSDVTIRRILHSRQDVATALNR